MEHALKIIVCLVLSFFIGLERETCHKEAGVRTIMIISLGAVTFTICAFLVADISELKGFRFDFSRIIAYVISGSGFFSGLVVMRNKDHIGGITTSACIWTTVAFSVIVGLGYYMLGTLVAYSMWCILKTKPLYKFISKGDK